VRNARCHFGAKTFIGPSQKVNSLLMADPSDKLLQKLDEIIQRLQVIDEIEHNLQSIEQSCRSIVDFVHRREFDGRRPNRDQRHPTRDDQPARLIEMRRPKPPDSPTSPVSPLRMATSPPKRDPTPPRPDSKPISIPKPPRPDTKAPARPPERKEPVKPPAPPVSGFFDDDANDFQFDE
jgi:hypothetical protein